VGTFLERLSKNQYCQISKYFLLAFFLNQCKTSMKGPENGNFFGGQLAISFEWAEEVFHKNYF